MKNPATRTHSTLQGDLGFALLLLWEGFCSPRPSLQVQGHERCGKSDWP